MKDKSGREIKVGDFIVYGQAWGRSAGINYGKVIKFGTITSFGKKTQCVYAIATDWLDEKKTNTKLSPLAISERILIVSEDQVGSVARKTLNAWEEPK